MKTRRAFLNDISKSVLTIGLCNLVLRKSVATEPGQAALQSWFQDLTAAAHQLAEGELTPAGWQAAMDEIYGRNPLRALLTYIDFDRVRKEMAHRDLGEDRGEVFDTLFVGQPGADAKEGAEPHRVLISKIAHVRKGRSIPPHGHGNMVSAFLNVSGEFHIRQFDKIADEPTSLLIRPTTNETHAGPGSWSSISDERHNVHWLTAKSEDCFLFTCKLIRLDPMRPLQGRINCDVLNGKDVGSGLIRAPKITSAQARERY